MTTDTILSIEDHVTAAKADGNWKVLRRGKRVVRVAKKGGAVEYLGGSAADGYAWSPMREA
jgi:hypothetical protein